MSKWLRCELTATLKADAHFGSGAGGNGVDALIARDREGKPVIWASHLEGVLRDAAYRLKGEDTAKAFFGQAGGPRQQALFTSLYTQQNPHSHIWRSTARTAFDNNAPKEDTLRAIEYVPKGTTFKGEVMLPEAQLPLLNRLVAEVDRLGAGRASGSGALTLKLTQKQPEPARGLQLSGTRLGLLLRNLDPLSLSATATPDNIIPTLAYLPGRTLLGALAAFLFDAGEQALAQALTDGELSVSDALPLPRKPEGEDLSALEVLPSPLALQHEKPSGSASELPWWAEASEGVRYVDAFKRTHTPSESTTEAKAPIAKLKRPSPHLFVARMGQGKPWQAYSPALRVRLRNGRPNPQQREPSLFAIEQIAEETYFYATLEGAPGTLERFAQALRPLLHKQRWLRVGRSGAPMEIERYATLEATKVPAEVAYLTLTSDLLLRDPYLRWATQLNAEALGLPKESLTVTRAFEEASLVHGFNGTSRLWRLPAHAIRRGSVYKVQGPGLDLLKARLEAGQWLGERTHEGFGRFRLDASLPGEGAAPGKGKPKATKAESEESIAATTYKWFEDNRSLAKKASATEPKPSLSQWFDLVADLDLGWRDAIQSRRNSETLGGRAWSQCKPASDILDELGALSSKHALYARYFVRWLRTELKGNRA